MSVSSVASLVFLSREDFSFGKTTGLGEEEISADNPYPPHLPTYTHQNQLWRIVRSGASRDNTAHMAVMLQTF